MTFEANLPHQIEAVDSVLKAVLELKKQSLAKKQEIPPVFDICMQTGTGKTYTYIKTMFELQKAHGIHKFIVLVPSLAIKAGAKNSFALTRSHFLSEYGGDLEVYEVQSQKGRANQKACFPNAVKSFCEANSPHKIEVLLLNAGMLNSKSFASDEYEDIESDLFSVDSDDKKRDVFNALAQSHSVLIIDEPHKFDTQNKTWQNAQKLQPHFILRYGATFKEYENLIFNLSPLRAFNEGLVKGVSVFVQEFKAGEKEFIKLLEVSNQSARFRDNKGKEFCLVVGESFGGFGGHLSDLRIEGISRKKEVELSNGRLLCKGERFNPSAFKKELQKQMIDEALREHFKLERQLMCVGECEARIKPLSLFFIDEISSYRGEVSSGAWLRGYFEQRLRELLKQELENCQDRRYRAYLKASLHDVSLTHGGYFARDNSSSDESIAREIDEILHDKQRLLDVHNVRRFIFSKWTLKEGWDNPNVFGICKLRSSGSEMSKLQEVGRGLRLPVNEWGQRVVDTAVGLNYFVDLSEKDFVERLKGEIEETSDTWKLKEGEELSKEVIEAICTEEKLSRRGLLNKLCDEGILDDDERLIDSEKLKALYPQVFTRLKNGKVKNGKEATKMVRLRGGVYEKLKELWEQINRKVCIVYEVSGAENGKGEKIIGETFKEYLLENREELDRGLVKIRKEKLKVSEKGVRSESTYTESHRQIKTMSYGVFLKRLHGLLGLRMDTLHGVFWELLSSKQSEKRLNINDYLSEATLASIERGFGQYLLHRADKLFYIGYEEISHSIHPTKITDKKGQMRESVEANDVGVRSGGEAENESYLYEEILFDSGDERKNIEADIGGVEAYMKIPKNSLKIPLVGGGSYSPDFAYVLKDRQGKRQYFVLETKGKKSGELSDEERAKIKHAQKFFSVLQKSQADEYDLEIVFKTQLDNKAIKDIIDEITRGE